jgi:futalosine hydrolase
MKLLIVAATRFEIEPLLRQTGLDSGSSEQKRLNCHYKKLEIDIVLTGVGMVATAYYTAKNLNASYNLAINAGICGSFNNNLETGAVVNVIEDRFSELGAEDGDAFLSLSELNLPGTAVVENTGVQTRNKVIELIPKVNGITVNTVHGNDRSIEQVIHKFHPIVESMEGAAFMFACQEDNIPYIQLRAVSNYVERRNRNNWNIPLAIKNLNEKIIEILDSFD